MQQQQQQQPAPVVTVVPMGQSNNSIEDNNATTTTTTTVVTIRDPMSSKQKMKKVVAQLEDCYDPAQLLQNVKLEVLEEASTSSTANKENNNKQGQTIYLILIVT